MAASGIVAILTQSVSASSCTSSSVAARTFLNLALRSAPLRCAVDCCTSTTTARLFRRILARALWEATWGATVRGTYPKPEAGTRTQYVLYVGPWGQATLCLQYVPNAGGWYA